MSFPRTDAEMGVKKNQLSPRGFTLIELLVVITVIAILMGLLFPAFKGVQDQAKQTQAKNDLTQVVTAVNAFYTEYGRYPVPGSPGGPDYFIFDSNSQNLMDVLRADGLSWDSSTGENLNPKRIVFFSPPYAKDPTNPRSGIAPGTGANAGNTMILGGALIDFVSTGITTTTW